MLITGLLQRLVEVYSVFLVQVVRSHVRATTKPPLDTLNVKKKPDK